MICDNTLLKLFVIISAMPLECSSYENYNMTTSFSYFNWKSFTNRTALNAEIDTDTDTDIINQNRPLNDQTQDYFKQSDKNPSKKSLNLELTNHKYGFSDIKTCPTPQEYSHSVAKR